MLSATGTALASTPPRYPRLPSFGHQRGRHLIAAKQPYNHLTKTHICKGCGTVNIKSRRLRLHVKTQSFITLPTYPTVVLLHFSLSEVELNRRRAMF